MKMNYWRKIGSLQDEIVTLSNSAVSLIGTLDNDNRSVKFCFETKEGNRKFSPNNK